jgi:trk system potassium uptake protein TrkH
MLVPLAAGMLIPAATDALSGHPDWRAFALGSALTFAFAFFVILSERCSLQEGLSLRQAFVLTPLAWLTIALFGAIPLYLSHYAQLGNSFTNAFFETMSGLTTTGSTVIVGLEHAPPGVLLWRSILQWMGGIGIIATAIVVLPTLGVGGMQLFRTESSDRSEKVMPRIREIARAITVIYLFLTVTCGLCYYVAGMGSFDAVNHALVTVSTGGFSTTDNSMGRWDIPAIHWIATIFMLSGSLPFVLYIRALQGDRGVFANSQVRHYLGFLAFAILSLTLWVTLRGLYNPLDALRHVAFNVVSVVTTTGFASTDYSLWGNLVIGVFFGLMFIGGCTGSTSGGMKIFRFEIMSVLLRSHFQSLQYPRGQFARIYAGRTVPDEVIVSVVVFFSLYFLCYSLITIALMMFDLDFLTSASAAVTALSNVGPGLGPIIGPAGNFSALPDAAKWLLSFAMLLGRLELFTVLILFSPRFWRG